MIRLGWAFDVAAAAKPAAIAQSFAAAELSGVELSFDSAEQLHEPAGRIKEAGIDIVGVASAIALPARLGSDSVWLDPVRRWLMATAELAVPQLRVRFDRPTGSAARPSAARLAEQLRALGEVAGQVGVRIAIDLAGHFQAPSELWQILELAGSSALSAGLVIDEKPGREVLDRGEIGVRSVLDAGGLQTGGVAPTVTQKRNADALSSTQTRNGDVAPISTPSRNVARIDAQLRARDQAIFVLNSRIAHVTMIAQPSLASRDIGGVIHHLAGIGYGRWIMLQAGAASLTENAAIVRALLPKAPKPPTPKK